jgi:predicted DNA binding CopG/RHH family protein
METIKVDKTKLKTIKNYAAYTGLTVQAIYKMVREERVKIEKIDGVTFIRV